MLLLMIYTQMGLRAEEDYLHQENIESISNL